MSEKNQTLLDRLVGQFASPYDFLRELVQNAMDAGSDLVEVELHQHPGDAEARVVFELVVVDSGAGMDEEIIDGELTRLFGTSKTDDRTMAGGFGIGFVSVFAWEPQRVLVQTGRGGQAWELLFREDARFEKRPVDMPLEGTTIRLFRSGDPSQRRAIAEAVEDA
ncbi:MAG: ATP-binding protein, partial [Nannocystaceae bacterium]|nr:ATP-binding protein [Nannocystaceae bacterium]